MFNQPEFDFIFISYDEPDAEESYNELLKIVPNAKRVHGVKGIANAWKKAGEIAEKPYFITMDADQRLNPDFSFHVHDWYPGDQRIHVWRSKNIVNNLVYGYGSIHMFPTQLVREFDQTGVVDFTLSVGTYGFKIQEECASTTCFNQTSYIAWKSAFREASKLASNTNLYVNSNLCSEQEYITRCRLYVWCSIGSDVENGLYTMLGARMGAEHGFINKNDPEKLARISKPEFFKNMWKQEVEVKSLNNLLYEYKSKLETNHDFIVHDYDQEQSKYLKTLWYNLNRDVINRNIQGIKLNY